MAKKTNCERNGKKYFRKYVNVGGKKRMLYAESEKDWNRKAEELKKLDSLGIIKTKDTLGEAMEMWTISILIYSSIVKTYQTYCIY